MRKFAVVGILALFVGCEQKPTTEFITTSNGLVYRANRLTGEMVLAGGKPDVAELVTTSSGLLYRLNKQSGELCLIVGAQISKLDEPGVKTFAVQPGTDDSRRSHITTWPDHDNKQLGGLKLQMKTNWRDGKLYYIFQVSPYAGRVAKERQKDLPYSQFIVRFYDGDGFEVVTIPLKLSEMVHGVDETGMIGSVTVNANTACSLETYESMKVWSIGWLGFDE